MAGQMPVRFVQSGKHAAMSVAQAGKPGFWRKSHHLDKMTFRELVVAYFQYPAIIAYLALSVVAIALFVWQPAPLVPTLAAVAVAVIAYPLVWYVLHRWVLHSNWMFKFAPLAATWKRIHYDHHQDPNRLEVLFGALHTTLPAIALATAPLGWLIGGFGGAMAALAAGLLTTCFYEFCHCIQHLNYTPKLGFLKEIKRLHLSHHYHNEQGNYGIANYFWDRLFRTYYAKAGDRPKSPTVFNLGYTAEEAQKYPWVDRLSGGTRGDGHPSRFWKGKNPDSVQTVVDEPARAGGER